MSASISERSSIKPSGNVVSPVFDFWKLVSGLPLDAADFVMRRWKSSLSTSKVRQSRTPTVTEIVK